MAKRCPGPERGWRGAGACSGDAAVQTRTQRLGWREWCQAPAFAGSKGSPSWFPLLTRASSPNGASCAGGSWVHPFVPGDT